MNFKKRFVRIFVFILPFLILLLAGEYIYLDSNSQKNISSIIDKVANSFNTKSPISSDQILQLTNNERRKNNVPELKKNNKLENAAKLKFADMIKNQYNADETYISDASYEYEYSSVNVVKNYPTSQAVMDGWMGSKKHKENILNANFTDAGVYVGTGNIDGEDTIFVVQIFGSPKKIISAKNKSSLPSVVLIPTNILGISSPPENPALTVSQVQSYLNSILAVKPSWEEAKERISSEDFTMLMDSFERQISFCQTIIDHLKKDPHPSEEDLRLWQGVTKMGNESSELTTKLFKKLTE